MIPLGHGSIGIGLYLHDGAAVDAVERLVAQAVAAEAAGFDSATVAEHHAGFRAYLPNPLLAASWLLGATRRIWSGPGPMLLPLRSTATVVEDLAWLDARFPGRVGATFAAGYHEDDFLALGRDDFADRGRRYGAQLLDVAAAMRGENEELLRRDLALTTRRATVPLAGAAGSKVAAQRAARAGVGLLMDSMAADDALTRVSSWYRDAGGDGPCVLGRRIWVGEPPLHLFEAQLAAYRGKADVGSWMQSVTAEALIRGPADVVIDGVLRAVSAARATVLVLRVHLPGLDPELADEQIRRVGEEVLPGLREAFTSRVEDG